MNSNDWENVVRASNEADRLAKLERRRPRAERARRVMEEQRSSESHKTAENGGGREHVRA